MDLKYIFNDNRDWLALVGACVPLSVHDPSPSYTLLGIIVSSLDNPGCILDNTLVYNLNSAILEDEHRNKIINYAVTLYVNMFNELEAMNMHHYKSYYLISAQSHILIGYI